MRVKSTENIMDIFKKAADKISLSFETGDYKKGNKEWNKIVKIYKLIEDDKTVLGDLISDMYHSEHEFLMLKAAAFSIVNQIDVNKALNVLNYLSANSQFNYIRFDASLTLKVIKEGEKISIY